MSENLTLKKWSEITTEDLSENLFNITIDGINNEAMALYHGLRYAFKCLGLEDHIHFNYDKETDQFTISIVKVKEKDNE